MPPRPAQPRSTSRRDYVRRAAPVYRLPGASEFTDDPQLQDPVFIVRALKRFPELYEPLVAGTTRAPSALGGRPRKPGSWALVYVVMTVLGAVDLEKFWARHQSSPIWQECGFDERPAWGTFYDRIVELETGDWGLTAEDVIVDPAADRRRVGGLSGRARPEVADDATDEPDEVHDERPSVVGAWPVFERAAAWLMRRARSRDARVGAHSAADGTAIHSHAQLEHCCLDETVCLARRTRSDGTVMRMPKVVERAGEDIVKAMHAAEDSSAEPQPGTPVDGALVALEPEDQWGEQLLADPDHKYVWIQGHLYRTRDTTAGLCMYGGDRGRRKRKVWIGGHELFNVDVFTGGLLSFNCLPADVREHEGWETLLRRARRNVGTWPGIVSADKGQGIKSVIEFNTRHGIHSAFPWRKDQRGRDARDFECARFDRHGVPRCQQCGGPGFVDGPDLGFRKDDGRGNPHIRFRCLTMWAGDACEQAGIQRVLCAENWKLLLPFDRTSIEHHTMRHLHNSGAEGPFHHWRQRYEAMGKTYSTRPKRRLSRHAHELRTACAMLIDWLRICLRHGWIGQHNRRNERDARLGRDSTKVIAKAERVRQARQAYGLDLPYGPAALACGAATSDEPPPKRRPRPRRAGPTPPDSVEPTPAVGHDDRPF